MVVFSVLYGIISFSFSYYGEMITYLGMTMPMAVLALISWVRNPSKNGKSEVKINRISKGETVFMFVLTAAVTAGFFFVLKAFCTANLFFSTVSVTTSFLAVYLTFRRSRFFCACLCGERCCFDYSLDSCRVQRYLRFCELVKNEKSQSEQNA